MPITLAKIARNTATVTIQDGEDTANIVYYPGRVTEKSVIALDVLSDASKNADAHAIAAGFGSFNQILVNLIESWEIFEDVEQTQMFPLESERLAELPLGLRIQIYQSIMSDIRPEAVVPQIQN